MQHGRLLVFLLLIGAGGSALAQTSSQAPSPASSQSWPTRPIRAVVPFSAGSASDVIPRVVLEQISAQLGQAIIVENRVGASGTIGTAAVAKAEPDGYMLLANSGAHTVTPWTVASIPYDILTDFISVTPFAVLPNVLVIAPSRGIRTVQELVAAARAKPGALTFASAGTGSATHLNAELFLRSAKLDAVHIPFKGGPEALTEVLTGRVDFYFVPVLPALPLLRDGKLLALAVSTSKRATSLPDVPTTVEAGFANSEYNFWVGLFAPSKTPREIVARLHDEAQKALQSPELKAKLAKLGAEPMLMTQSEFDAYIRAEHAAMGELVKTSGIGIK
jgi:tripartite-type tricarboxylate transporter receptor subunit TctC